MRYLKGSGRLDRGEANNAVPAPVLQELLQLLGSQLGLSEDRARGRRVMARRLRVRPPRYRRQAAGGE